MANNKSSKKRILIIAKKTERNRYYRTSIKNIVKTVHEAVDDSGKSTTIAFAEANKSIQALVRKGFLKKSTAIRKMNRLYKMANITEFDKAESQIPLKAKDTFIQASNETLNAGDSILKVIGDTIYTVDPDGNKTKIKNIKTPIQIKKNSKISLKRIG